LIVSESSIKPVRVLHLVSSEGVTGPAQQALFMPMLTRMPKARVKPLVISLSPNVVPGAVLRQNGVPVYDAALSKRRFSLAAFGQLLKTVRAFRPDVIQAWGHTAQIASSWLRGRCDWDAKLIWSVANTMPLPRKAGMIDRQKLKCAATLSRRVDRIVYASEASASAHRRVGFPDGGHAVVPLGVDPTRFKPDFASRRKTREQLGLANDAFVIGMMAPFQPEYDYPTLLKAVGELIKTNPQVSVLLAGHGVQKGNGPLMALVGGGTLGTRTQLLGEWSDLAAFFNACDIACSSALTDNARMPLVIAMLCGVPCVATGMGAQGEVIGQHGVAVEPGSPAALIRGITRIMQLPQDKRVSMAHGARKHALTQFASIRSLQKYLQLYYDLVGRELEAASSVPAPKIDAAIPAPRPEDLEPSQPAAKPKTNRTVDMYDLADPDSLEARDTPSTHAPTLKPNDADVLHLFETSMAKQANAHASPMSERARGVPEDHEDLLAPEVLQASASEPEPMSSPVMVEAAASSPATLPTTLAAEPATEPVIAPKAPPLVDTTITVSMKVSLDATGTLEIPPEMIFAPAPVAKSPTMAVDGPLNQKDAAAAASDSKQSEAQQLDLLGDSAPKIAAG
jgi:glycosyltransferase involved in cell wall biosynthesis